MAVLFRVGFEGVSHEIELVAEGQYVVTVQQALVLDLLDEEDRPAVEPKHADTFARALAAIPGWEQGAPLVVDPEVADAVSAALVDRERRTSHGWQEWLRTGKTEDQ